MIKARRDTVILLPDDLPDITKSGIHLLPDYDEDAPLQTGAIPATVISVGPDIKEELDIVPGARVYFRGRSRVSVPFDYEGETYSRVRWDEIDAIIE